MSELAKIRLRTLGWLILPIVVLAVVPNWLRHLAHETFAWSGGVVQWLGVWLIANGVSLSAWCVNLFNVEGKGTPLPLDPPKRFVVKGPYRFVRNPMMLGAFLILWGEAALFQSTVCLWYALALMLVAHLFVCLWEEPDLTRRFGKSYLDYQRVVPRWLPRPFPRAK